MIPFPAGYGVEIAMLIDTLNLHGLQAIAQADLGTRRNRHQPLRTLGEMTYAVLAAVQRRVDAQGTVAGGQYARPWNDGHYRLNRSAVGARQADDLDGTDTPAPAARIAASIAASSPGPRLRFDPCSRRPRGYPPPRSHLVDLSGRPGRRRGCIVSALRYMLGLRCARSVPHPPLWRRQPWRCSQCPRSLQARRRCARGPRRP